MSSALHTGGGSVPPSSEHSNAVPRADVVDREKVCPLLLRVFVKQNRPHTADDFKSVDAGNGTCGSEMQMYTWRDATLKELSLMILSATDAEQRHNARLRFSLVFPSTSPGCMSLQSIGQVHSSRPSADDQRCLQSFKFETGDYLAVSIYHD